MPRVSAFGILRAFGLGEVYLLFQDFAGVLPSLNLSTAMEQSEQSIQEQRDAVIKDFSDGKPKNMKSLKLESAALQNHPLFPTVDLRTSGNGRGFSFGRWLSTSVRDFREKFGTVDHGKPMECGIMSIIFIHVLQGCSNAYGRKWRNWKTSIKKWT